MKLISTSRQRWLDEDIEIITKGIVDFLENSGVITTADLADFSDELKESVDFILCR